MKLKGKETNENEEKEGHLVFVFHMNSKVGALHPKCFSIFS